MTKFLFLFLFLFNSNAKYDDRVIFTLNKIFIIYIYIKLKHPEDK